MFLQVFVGKADSLHDELMKHFDSFGQKRHKIREIDDELCHHTDSSGWNVRKLNERKRQTKVMLFPLPLSLSQLTVHAVPDDQDLELEWAKKIVEHDSLVAPNSSGINESLTFTNRDTFDNFWEWLSPN